SSPCVPYTTLFRSPHGRRCRGQERAHPGRDGGVGRRRRVEDERPIIARAVPVDVGADERCEWDPRGEPAEGGHLERSTHWICDGGEQGVPPLERARRPLACVGVA